MKKLLTLAAMLLFAGSVAASEPSGTYTKVHQMLEPSIQVATLSFAGTDVIGSATGVHFDGTYTYYASADHVTAYATDTMLTMWARIPQYDVYGIESFVFKPIDLLFSDEDNDVSLFRVEGEFPTAFISGNDDGGPKIFQHAWAVGASLGFDPRPTDGTITAVRDNFVESSVPVLPGNSGGGLFVWDDIEDRYELAGIVSQVYILPQPGGGKDIMTHVSLHINIKTLEGALDEYR